MKISQYDRVIFVEYKSQHTALRLAIPTRSINKLYIASILALFFAIGFVCGLLVGVNPVLMAVGFVSIAAPMIVKG